MILDKIAAGTSRALESENEKQAKGMGTLWYCSTVN